MAAIVVANNLTKEYDGKAVLLNLNLTISEGERFALVGDASCGKTTLLRLLSGLSSPSRGECSMAGLNPSGDSAKEHKRIGVVLDTSMPYANLTANENLLYAAAIHEINRNDTIDRMSFLLHGLDIWEFRDMKVSEMPTSARQKLRLAMALLHSPRLLLFDEPADGMNYETTISVKEMIDHIVEEEGATVIFSTRLRTHAELICDNFAIMAKGEIIARGSKDSLLEKSRLRPKAVFRIADESDPPEGFTFTEDGQWRREIASEDEMPQLIAKSADTCEIIEATVEKPTLEDIYAAFISGNYRLNDMEETLPEGGDTIESDGFESETDEFYGEDISENTDENRDDTGIEEDLGL